MKIEIETRNAYGNTNIYPVCDKAITFAAIAGTKTLTRSTMIFIERLGYKIIDTTKHDWRNK